MGKILKEEFVLYQKKSQDYGTKPVEETGVVGLLVRIVDKVHRALNLANNGMEAKVVDENLEDTLMDISNYANMCLIELLTLKAKEEVKERFAEVEKEMKKENERIEALGMGFEI